MAKKSKGGVYRIVDVVGVSKTSWEDAGKRAVETAAASLRDLRIAEVTKMDMTVRERQGLGVPHPRRAVVQIRILSGRTTPGSDHPAHSQPVDPLPEPPRRRHVGTDLDRKADLRYPSRPAGSCPDSSTTGPVRPAMTRLEPNYCRHVVGVAADFRRSTTAAQRCRRRPGHDADVRDLAAARHLRRPGPNPPPAAPSTPLVQPDRQVRHTPRSDQHRVHLLFSVGDRLDAGPALRAGARDASPSATAAAQVLLVNDEMAHAGEIFPRL